MLFFERILFAIRFVHDGRTFSERCYGILNRTRDFFFMFSVWAFATKKNAKEKMMTFFSFLCFENLLNCMAKRKKVRTFDTEVYCYRKSVSLRRQIFLNWTERFCFFFFFWERDLEFSLSLNKIRILTSMLCWKCWICKTQTIIEIFRIKIDLRFVFTFSIYYWIKLQYDSIINEEKSVILIYVCIV